MLLGPHRSVVRPLEDVQDEDEERQNAHKLRAGKDEGLALLLRSSLLLCLLLWLRNESSAEAHQGEEGTGDLDPFPGGSHGQRIDDLNDELWSVFQQENETESIAIAGKLFSTQIFA